MSDDNVKLARGFISGEPVMLRLNRLGELLKARKGAAWNCYRCDQCGFTHRKPGVITNHIKSKADHDEWRVGASWVGDHNAPRTPGIINGEPIMVRLERIKRDRELRNARECQLQPIEMEAQQETEETSEKRKATEALEEEILRYRVAWEQFKDPIN